MCDARSSWRDDPHFFAHPDLVQELVQTLCPALTSFFLRKVGLYKSIDQLNAMEQLFDMVYAVTSLKHRES